MSIVRIGNRVYSTYRQSFEFCRIAGHEIGAPRPSVELIHHKGIKDIDVINATYFMNCQLVCWEFPIYFVAVL